MSKEGVAGVEISRSTRGNGDASVLNPRKETRALQSLTHQGVHKLMNSI
jgi:hypothetical protein